MNRTEIKSLLPQINRLASLHSERFSSVLSNYDTAFWLNYCQDRVGIYDVDLSVAVVNFLNMPSLLGVVLDDEARVSIDKVLNVYRHNVDDESLTSQDFINLCVYYHVAYRAFMEWEKQFDC